MSLAIFIKSAGANVNRENLKDTLESIIENTEEDFKFYLTLEESQKTVLDEIDSGKYVEEVRTAKPQNSWAYDYNNFYDLVKDKYEWVLYSHDDIKILSKSWFRKSKEVVGTRKDIGWITYSQPTWYMHYGEPRSQVARPGFHSDRHRYPCIHEGHLFDRAKHWNRKKDMKNVLDMPKHPVKIHGPYSVFNLITMSSMKKIGYCSDWNPYTMLIDEDWALESLRNNLTNIWIPSLFYLHPLRWNERKAPDRFKSEAKDGFYKKWGFAGGSNRISDEVIDEVCEQYKDTNIPWSRGRKSFEWDYL